jgi:hypothetical protein
MFFFSAQACSEVRFSFAIGESDIELSNDYEFEDNTAGDDASYTDIHVGYLTDYNLIFDLGFSSINDDYYFGADDNIRFESLEALLGYLFKYKRLYIEPKIGVARWELELEEGRLFNFWPEEKREDNGTDIFLMITAGVRFTDLFGISLSYKHQDFDHGEVKSLLFGFDFEF